MGSGQACEKVHCYRHIQEAGILSKPLETRDRNASSTDQGPETPRDESGVSQAGGHDLKLPGRWEEAQSLISSAHHWDSIIGVILKGVDSSHTLQTEKPTV